MVGSSSSVGSQFNILLRDEYEDQDGTGGSAPVHPFPPFNYDNPHLDAVVMLRPLIVLIHCRKTSFELVIFIHRYQQTKAS